MVMLAEEMEVIEAERVGDEIEETASCETVATENETFKTGAIVQLLKYSDNELTPELEKHARIHLNESPENISRCIEEMRTILKGNPYIYFLDEDSILILFLRFKKFDVQKSVKLYLGCINHSHTYYEVFGRTDFQVVKRFLDQNIFGYLKYRDADGRAIIWVRFGLWDTKSFPSEDLMFASMVTILSSIYNPVNQVAGFVAILDLEGVQIKQALALVPWINFTIKALQNACAGFLKNAHVIYTSAIYQYLWSLIKPLLTEKLQKRFVFHKKDDLSTLYEYLPRDVLPPELGGTIPFSNDHWTHDMDGIQKRYRKLIQCNGYSNKHKSKSTRWQYRDNEANNDSSNKALCT